MPSKPGGRQTFNVGLIGYGVAGAVFHAPLIAATPGLRLTHIVTAAPERVRAALGMHPQAAVLPDPQSLWQHASELDLVVVATPNNTHAPLTRAALNAGLHVVVDKPFAPDVGEARELVALARHGSRHLTVFQNRRWDNDFLTLKALLAGNELGTVHRFESRFERWRPEAKPGWKRSGAREDAGGILFDLGSHLIDQALRLFGPVTRVYAELDRRYPDSEVDDDSFLAITHRNGVRSHLWMSSVAAQSGPRLRVLGGRGAFVKYGLDPQEDALRRGERPDTAAAWGAEDPAGYGWLGTDAQRQRVPSQPGDYPRFYAEVAAALRGECAMPVDPLDAIASLEVIQAALRSWAEGSCVPL